MLMLTLDTSARAARSINRQGRRQAQQLCISMFFCKRDVCPGKSHEVVKQLDQEEEELGLTHGGVPALLQIIISPARGSSRGCRPSKQRWAKMGYPSQACPSSGRPEPKCFTSRWRPPRIESACNQVASILLEPTAICLIKREGAGRLTVHLHLRFAVDHRS